MVEKSYRITLKVDDFEFDDNGRPSREGLFIYKKDNSGFDVSRVVCVNGILYYLFFGDEVYREVKSSDPDIWLKV